MEAQSEVARHPLIGKKVQFAIITFADTAEVRLSMSELSEELLLPTLTPRGRGTSYTSALEALRHTLPSDVALLKSRGYVCLAIHEPARPLVVAVADGVSAAPRSHVGAALAVRYATAVDVHQLGRNEGPTLGSGVGSGAPGSGFYVVPDRSGGPGRESP